MRHPRFIQREHPVDYHAQLAFGNKPQPLAHMRGLEEDLASVPPALARFDAQLQGPRRLTLRYQPSRTRIGEILAAVQAAGLTVVDLTTLEADLEDIFLQLTAGAADAGSAP